MRKAATTIEGLPVWFDARQRRIADSRGILSFQKIVVGPAFFRFSDRERLAILYHEVGHLKARAIERRLANLWRALLCPDSLAALCREQEFAADAYAKARGYGRELIEILQRFPSAGGFLYPSSTERIARLLAPAQA